MSLLDTQASKYKLLYQQWSYLPLLWWLARGVLETPALQAIAFAIALGYFLELDGNTLLLKTPHTSVIE